MKKESFNKDWLFVSKKSEIKKRVTLPHDAMQGEERRADCESGSAGAYYPGGVYEYEKHFTAPEQWAQQHIVFEFEGVYKNARVYINGKEAGGAAYGYIPFFVCADGLLGYGEDNVIKVTADNSRLPDSRWYTGAGIYRPIWLHTGGKTYIEPEGIRIKTLDYRPARIQAEVLASGGEAEIEILDQGKVIAAASGKRAEMTLPDAVLWSEDTPYLYTCRVTLKENGKTVDTAETAFGVRKIEWGSRGLFINGKETLLRGGCLHHDNGILGAAAYKESEWRRVRLLKEAGYNAIRSSHNPASRAMLEACDALGVYMLDETWDMWYSKKSRYDYAEDFEANYKYDLRAMVERDYNHPCVIMYSIGNEVSEPAFEKGRKLAGEMVDYVHTLDDSRPVTGGINLMIIAKSSKGKGIYKEDGSGADTAGNEKKMQGMSSTMFNMITSMVGSSMNKAANSKTADAVTSPVLDTLDIAGYNYASGRYPLEGAAHPERVIFGSETFPQDIYKNWEMVRKYPYLIGDFMWTAWDYLGEAGIGAWAYTPDGKGFNKPYPWLLADVGTFDILGNPNGELFWAQAVWGCLKNPAIAVQPVNHDRKPAKGAWRGTNAIPCWSFQGCEGRKAVVEVYTQGAAAELFLNGKSLGKKKTKECRAVFQTKYAPGRLEAAAYDRDGKETGRSVLQSANGRIGITLMAEKNPVKAGELVYVDVALTDQNGNLEGNADCRLKAEVRGAELMAFGSANPRTEERFDSGSYSTYYGKALLAVRAAEKGSIYVKVSGEAGTAEITIKAE